MKVDDTIFRSSKPTQQTIADVTGFAVTTVSRALANDSKISPKTRKIVAETARELGYVPDRAAQRLRTGRTNVITLVLDPHSEVPGFASSMIAGIADVVRNTRYHLTIMQYQLGEDPLEPIRFLVRNKQADGIIFARTEHDDLRVAFLLEKRFPFVSYGRTKFQNHAWFDFDNRMFAKIAVKRLVDRGCRTIGIIPPSRKFTYSKYMIQGFQEAISNFDVTGVITDDFHLNIEPMAIYRHVGEWIRTAIGMDGLICPGEASAIAARAAIIDAGLEPEVDIKLVAKQTSVVFDHLRPTFDTINEDLEGAGRELMRLMLRHLSGEKPENLQLLESP